jgi:hypothetical protein
MSSQPSAIMPTERSPSVALVSRERTPALFWIVGFILALYVALCTAQRDNVWDSDSWEHHRALLELTRHFWHPGNPTYAIDVPSVRYSPYLIVQAAIARMTGIDPYRMLSAAAVINTALLVLGIGAVLKSFGEQASAALALVVVVGLYWGSPAYANSLALADLPPLQVNPSAWSFAIGLFAWSLFKWSLDRNGGSAWVWPLLTLVAAMCVLDHAMSGLFTLLGLFVIAVTRPTPRRWRWAGGTVLVGAAAFGLGMLWPWYSLLDAIRWKADSEYWFNVGILRLALTRWCVPGLFCGLAALTMVQRDLIRTFLIGGAMTVVLGLLSLLTKSPVLARMPIIGNFFFAMATAVYLHRSGACKLRTWAAHLDSFRRGRTAPPEAVLQSIVLLWLAWGLLPQFEEILTERWLARVYVAEMFHRENKQLNIKSRLDALLAGVGERDVVLSDLLTSWPVPSSAGKIVAGVHYELFVPDQATRTANVEQFFSRADPARRLEMIENYKVRWILLNQKHLEDSVFRDLLDPRAVVKRDNDLVLMDAKVWRSDH